MKNLLLLAVWCISFGFSSSAKNNFIGNSPSLDTLKKGQNFILFSKSSAVDNITFSKSKKPKTTNVYIRFGFPTPIPASNVANAQVITSKRYKEDGVLPVFDKIDILKGNYADITTSKDTKYRSLFTLTGVEYPLRLKLTSGTDTVDLELTEPGEWNMEIELKNN
ncbi:hypothetical protein WG904_08835 [Pedobacter sp. Du54]|uniref:hypothetical protein n=1 Tax=Pedobacter anseongensis TaxID=3133439 RepID=UPI0030AC9D33